MTGRGGRTTLRRWRRHGEVSLAEQSGERQEHPRLRPPHIGGADRVEPEHSIIEEASSVPHVIHRPPEDRPRQSDVARVEILQLEERDDALRDTVDVDWIRAVVEVSARTVLAKEVGAVELEPAPDARVELSGLRVPGDGSQPAALVSGAEVLDPALGPPLAAGPRAVGVLLRRRRAGRPEGRPEEFLLTRMPVHTAQERGAEEVRVVDANPH